MRWLALLRAATRGSRLPVSWACCCAMRMADSMSTTRFSSRERDRLCISSSSWLRCSATSPTRASCHREAGGCVAHQFLGLARHGAGLDGLGSRISRLASQLLLDGVELLPQQAAADQGGNGHRAQKIGAGVPQRCGGCDAHRRASCRAGRRSPGCLEAAVAEESLGGTRLMPPILSRPPRHPVRAGIRARCQTRRHALPVQCVGAWPARALCAVPGQVRRWPGAQALPSC
jgi:hypothetical protein